MAKFYYTNNVARLVAGFEFVKAEFFAPTSSWCGILASDDAETIGKLDAAAAARECYEITEVEYDGLVAKAKAKHNISVTKMKTFISPDTGIATGKAAQVVENPAAKAAPTTQDVLQPTKGKK
jgi:hypothetical protein